MTIFLMHDLAFSDLVLFNATCMIVSGQLQSVWFMIDVYEVWFTSCTLINKFAPNRIFQYFVGRSNLRSKGTESIEVDQLKKTHDITVLNSFLFCRIGVVQV